MNVLVTVEEHEQAKQEIFDYIPGTHVPPVYTHIMSYQRHFVHPTTHVFTLHVVVFLIFKNPGTDT